ncbi:class I adenylate-forming enzyme family protein [Amycolatopsis sp. cmx-4-68]|uniref:class I adenylate-forming enzyme family protein n=1 Tax=Amycolatopsis sp. cmx-4-68 TaxID=2790938 RepID=UPI00397E5FAA
MLTDVFADAARRHPARLAVTDASTRLTYGELVRRTAEVTDFLAGHGRAGRPARVGLFAANSVDYVVCYLGILFSGNVPFLIDSAFGPRELALIADDCGLDLLVHDDRPVGPGATPLGGCPGGTGGLGLAKLPTPEHRPDLLPDTEVCRFTSGSTGKPNCIEFSGAAVSAAAANWAEGTGLAAEDRVACFAGLSNGLAFNTSLLSVFLVGASLHLSRGLPTGGRIARLIADVEATRLVGFPALYESLLRRGLANEVVRRIGVAISSGAPLRPESRQAFAEQTGLAIRNYYGLAEAGPLTFATAPDAGDGLGAALPGVRLLAGVPGEPAVIRVRSQSMGSRYLNAPGVFEARLDGSGYYRSGDEGYLDDGVLHLTGRTGRVINVGGRKIDPIEVADALRGFAGVHEAVVFEDTDRRGDALVTAAVTGGASLTVAGLRAHCARQLADYKVPARILVLGEIPGNSIGKPSLSALRELAARAHG